MTNDNTSTNEFPSTAFGARLQSAREALGLNTKDAAARLRLNEKMIIMLEKEHYPHDLPITFIRGYLRSYGKLLQIPEHEIKKALEPIQPKPIISEPTPTKSTNKPAQPVTSKNYSMKISTYFIAFTMVGLFGAWWFTHNPNKDASSTTSLLTDNKLLQVPNETIQPATHPLAVNTPSLVASNDTNTPTAEAPSLSTTQPAATQSKPAIPTTKQKAASTNDDNEDYIDDASSD